MVTFYRLLLENLSHEVESALRMLDSEPTDLVPLKSTLRRALKETQEGIRSFEAES